MLTLELTGRSVSSADNQQPLKIHGNPVEVERVGDAIYVNKIAINVVVVDKTRSLGQKIFLGVYAVGAVGAIALLVMNHESVIPVLDSAVQFVQSYASSAIDFVGGYFGGTETVPTEPVQPAE